MSGGAADHPALSVEIGLGAFACRLTVTSAVSPLRDRFTERIRRWANRLFRALIFLADLIIFAQLANVNALK